MSATTQSAITHATSTTDSRWQAVQTRDRIADGAFVYAVKSTGIYCRPSCASRKPRRAQVIFFPLPEDAEKKGFRACRRCRPNIAPPGDPQTAAVANVCAHIATTLRDPNRAESETALTLPSLAKRAGISTHQLERAFQRITGITPRQYVDAHRMRRLKSRL